MSVVVNRMEDHLSASELGTSAAVAVAAPALEVSPESRRPVLVASAVEASSSLVHTVPSVALPYMVSVPAASAAAAYLASVLADIVADLAAAYLAFVPADIVVEPMVSRFVTASACLADLRCEHQIGQRRCAANTSSTCCSTLLPS